MTNSGYAAATACAIEATQGWRCLHHVALVLTLFKYKCNLLLVETNAEKGLHAMQPSRMARGQAAAGIVGMCPTSISSTLIELSGLVRC